jgi:hypothetical protein
VSEGVELCVLVALGVTVDVEFGVEVLVRAVFPENPEPSVQGAFHNEATGDVQLVLTAPQ